MSDFLKALPIEEGAQLMYQIRLCKSFLITAAIYSSTRAVSARRLLNCTPLLNEDALLHPRLDKTSPVLDGPNTHNYLVEA